MIEEYCIEHGYLFDKTAYEKILDSKAKKDYCQLTLKSYPIKYAMRTLNNLLKIDSKEELKTKFIEDIESGQWTIDIVDNISEVEDFFKERSLKEIQSELIRFCLDWASNS